MKTYYSVLRLRLYNGMQYRAAAFAGLATQFFWGFMYIMIFEAFYSNATSMPPMSFTELVTYLWLQQSLLALIMLWFRDNELFQLITTGNIAYELCRPCDIYGFWYAKLIGQRLAAAMLRCYPILIVAFFLPEPYRMTLPPDIQSFLLFLTTLTLGLLLLVAISMLLYISVFITMSPVGSLLMFGVIGEFFAGLIIPIPLFPDWLQKIAYILPFRLTADLPFRVYSGHIPANEAIISIGVQIIWLLILIGFGKLALRGALRRVVVQGG